MILSHDGDSVRIVRQDDHAALAAVLARHWGNDVFERPEPFDPVVLATSLHDNGWREWDAAPRVNPTTHLPYQFTELPVKEHLAFYQAGVKRALACDRYAGLLVNMHCVGLYNQRYGIDPSIPKRHYGPEDEAVIRLARERLEAEQRELLTGFRSAGMAPVFSDEERLWMNYRLLQAYDRFSLYLCMPPYEKRALGPVPTSVVGRIFNPSTPTRVGQVANLPQPALARQVGNLPHDVDLSLLPRGQNVVTLAPYPFSTNPLCVTVPARFIPCIQYQSDEEVRTALARTRGDHGNNHPA